MTAQELAQALLSAVRQQDFAATADHDQNDAPLGLSPSIDLAVAAFPGRGDPVCANVLFSREHPDGLVAAFDGPAGTVSNIRFETDLRDDNGVSLAWQPGADWARLPFRPWFGAGTPRFVAPYPASLVKLMVLVGVATLIDRRHSHWHHELAHGGRQRTVAQWAMDMMAISCNDATEALVAHLHGCGAIQRQGDVETHNELHETFAAYGLPGLRLANTRPDGGWRNADGAGVGELQMTAWDALRLCWLIDPKAPPAPWLPRDMPRLLAGSHAFVCECMDEQALHEILSSGALAALPGWVPGIPAQLPARGQDRVGQRGPQALSAEVSFAHKTGTTDTYASDAGWVQGIAPFKRHYLVAITTTLGKRFNAHPAAATTWRLPALGAAIDAALKPWLEA